MPAKAKAAAAPAAAKAAAAGPAAGRSAAHRRAIVNIHVLRGRLQLPEDEYRDLLGNLFDGRRSSTALTEAQCHQLARHLAGLVQGSGGAAAAPARVPLTPRQAKLYSLWQQLADAGQVRDRGMAALKAWATRQTHVDRIEWLNKHQEGTLIESLKAWLARGHAAPPAPAAEGGNGH